MSSFYNLELNLVIIKFQKNNKVLSKFTKTQTLLSSESSEDDTIKVSLDIIMKDDLDQNNLIKEISSIKGLSEVVIIAAKTDIDY